MFTARIDCDKIRKLRLSCVDGNGKYLSVFHLSKLIEINGRVISLMENKETYNPGVLTILKYAEYFNVSIDDLLIKD